MKKTLILVLMALLMAITACDKGQKAETDVNKLKPDTVIMKVNGESIDKAQFDDAFNKIYMTSPFGQLKIDLNEPKNQNLKLLITDKAVSDLVARSFIQGEAKAKGIIISDEDIEKLYNQISEKIGGKQRLLDQIKVANLDEKKFKDNLKEDLLTRKVVDSLTKDVTITDQDVKNYYQQHKEDKFNVPETVRVSHIFIDTKLDGIKREIQKENPKISNEELDKLANKKLSEKDPKKILSEALSGKNNFAELANKYSDDRLTAMRGGDLGYFPKGKVVEPLNSIVFNSKKVQVGKVYNQLVTTPAGIHIIKVTDHRKAGLLPFDLVKADIKRIMADEKKVETLNKFISSKSHPAKLNMNTKISTKNILKNKWQKILTNLQIWQQKI